MYKLMVFTIVCLFLSSCCFSNPNVVKKEFWEKKKTAKIGVAIEYYRPSFGIYKYNGVQDNNYDSNIPSQWQQYLENVDLTRFTRIKENFVKNLSTQGFNVKEISYFKRDWDSKAIYNVTPLAIEESIDILILLRIGEWGVLNDYDKENNLKTSYVFFDVFGDMLSMKGGKMRGGWTSQLWRDSLSQKKNIVPINGDWNQPPDYLKVTEALNKAMDNAREYLLNSFFANSGI